MNGPPGDGHIYMGFSDFKPLGIECVINNAFIEQRSITTSRLLGSDLLASNNGVYGD